MTEKKRDGFVVGRDAHFVPAEGADPEVAALVNEVMDGVDLRDMFRDAAFRCAGLPPCRCGCGGPSTHRVVIAGCGREDGVEYACAPAARHLRSTAAEFGGRAILEERSP